MTKWGRHHDVCAPLVNLQCGLFLVLLAVSWFASLSVLSAAEKPSSPQVIILNSYHPGFTWSDNELAGVLQELRQEYPNLDPAIEYLDTKRFLRLHIS